LKKFGVISDTHELSGERVIRAIGDHFDDVDGIIHCGDVVGMEVVDALETIAPLILVAGNMDTIDIKKRFPRREIFGVEGKRIGVIHGWGTPHGILSKILYEFRGESLDAVVFGHTHERLILEKDGVLFFNPGSLLDRVFTSVNSLGILEIGSSLTGKIVEIEP
jgi:hypothetical protein